jgi:DNA invertase Pin-like site-specific DNA recombinase
MAEQLNTGAFMDPGNFKVTASHLKREAYLYVRQSTLHQVLQNTESTQRQYALQQRAVALGWPMERVHVIDCDLAHSGASTVDREGFQQLVTEVSLGHCGLVLGLEVSRLARNSADWQRLLELCALTDTLILDEDGLYDCSDFNDRMLLGLKGTLSEAELHFLRARLHGGILSKARRGELASPLPVGLIYDGTKHVRLDPDQQVQQAIRLLFETFHRTGTAWGGVAHFRREGLQFPRRLRSGTRKGELVWGELHTSQALHILHNPRYAGAFFFGSTRNRIWLNGKKHTQRLAMEDWLVLIPNLHPGYISWEEYQDNQRRLRENAQAHGGDRRASPPREGPALLQGLVICGVCGHRMTVRYHIHWGRLYPDYICQHEKVERCAPICQQVSGRDIDTAVSGLLLESMTPISLEVALAVQKEMSMRLQEADALRAKQVARSQYAADLTAQRYRCVDPNNRLVASTLEAEWNAALKTLQEVQQEYDHHRQMDRQLIDAGVQEQIMALATDFPRVWNDVHTTDHDRKRLLRLLIEDVTLIKAHEITVQVRFRSGAARTLTLPAPRRNWKGWVTAPEVIEMIDSLLNEYTDGQVAAILNARGLHAGKGGVFHERIIANLRTTHGLKSRYDRLREAGMLTVKEMIGILQASKPTVLRWYHAGILHGSTYNSRGGILLEPPATDIPQKHRGQMLTERRSLFQTKVLPESTKEVQYES